MLEHDKKEHFSQDKLEEIIVKKYHTTNQKDANAILNAFKKYIKYELLESRDVVIDKFGTFTKKICKPIWTKDAFGRRKWTPEHVKPFFKTDRKFRNFLNNNKKED